MGKMTSYVVARCTHCRAIRASYYIGEPGLVRHDTEFMDDITNWVLQGLVVEKLITDKGVTIQDHSPWCGLVQKDKHHKVFSKSFKLFKRNWLFSLNSADWKYLLWYDRDPQGLMITNWFRIGHVNYWNSNGFILLLGPLSFTLAYGDKLIETEPILSEKGKELYEEVITTIMPVFRNGMYNGEPIDPDSMIRKDLGCDTLDLLDMFDALDKRFDLHLVANVDSEKDFSVAGVVAEVRKALHGKRD
jgi:acyl carrier protein